MNTASTGGQILDIQGNVQNMETDNLFNLM